ncbi:mRNA-capping enzyme subunit (MCE1) [Vairimorpha necatrix]|uniref:mRNA guanylyltransferase n=1 Tax=Vairimorpha necatrix TaxID=6039 RepID=A0AAX4JA90_9MICR
MNVGTKLENEEKIKIYKRINELLKIDNPVNSYKFIGNHPISLTNDNIILLLKEDYMVCEKSDGVRMICLVIDQKIYFYDRKNEIYLIKDQTKTIDNTNVDNNDNVDNTNVDQTKTVDNNTNVNIYTNVDNTNVDNANVDNNYIVDGELFYDNSGKLNYAVFDCLLFNNENVCDKNLLKRLGYADLFIRNLIYKGDINFYLKIMYKSYGFLEIYNQIKNLNHKNDGLIFTPCFEKYILYKRGLLLKWKPPSINTIDFRLVKRSKGIYSLECSYKNNEIIFDYFESDHEDLNNKIGEFIFDKDRIIRDIENEINILGGWVLYKIRDDKDTPNHYRVVNNILESLEDNLDINELSRYYKPMRHNTKHRMK